MSDYLSCKYYLDPPRENSSSSSFKWQIHSTILTTLSFLNHSSILCQVISGTSTISSIHHPWSLLGPTPDICARALHHVSWVHALISLLPIKLSILPSPTCWSNTLKSYSQTYFLGSSQYTLTTLCSSFKVQLDLQKMEYISLWNMLRPEPSREFGVNGSIRGGSWGGQVSLHTATVLDKVFARCQHQSRLLSTCTVLHSTVSTSLRENLRLQNSQVFQNKCPYPVIESSILFLSACWLCWGWLLKLSVFSISFAALLHLLLNVDLIVNTIYSVLSDEIFPYIMLLKDYGFQSMPGIKWLA